MGKNVTLTSVCVQTSWLHQKLLIFHVLSASMANCQHSCTRASDLGTPLCYNGRNEEKLIFLVYPLYTDIYIVNLYLGVWALDLVLQW